MLLPCALIQSFVTPLSNNHTGDKLHIVIITYHVMINLVCNNYDRQYIKYYIISHITTEHR